MTYLKDNSFYYCMQLDNEPDSGSIENETFTEYLSILAEDPETYHTRGFNTANLQALSSDSPTMEDVEPYLDEMMERDILEKRFDGDKGNSIYTLTDQAHEDLDVDEQAVLKDDEGTYWAGRDDNMAIIYTLDGKNEKNLGMTEDVAENHFFLAENGDETLR